MTPTAAFQDLGQQGAGVRVSNGDSNPGTLRQNVRTIFFLIIAIYLKYRAIEKERKREEVRM